MCGLIGIAASAGARPGIGREAFLRLRDALAHRGPDGEGVFERENVLLGHRRLAVIDPTPGGVQPMVRGDLALVYNGELYNDAELRREMAALGVEFRTRCDTETVLEALRIWGTAALPKFRGMFALGLVDLARQTLLLARDPLGVKPLYYREYPGQGGGTREVAFASEIPALLADPRAPRRPDLATASAYLTTIRTTLGSRTMYEGVATLLPGEARVYDLRSPALACVSLDWWREVTRRRDLDAEAMERTHHDDPTCLGTRNAIEDSLRRHLRSDVPVCCLLSGGLDSTITATLARRELGESHRLLTFCAGAREQGSTSGPRNAGTSDDFAFARLAALSLRSEHHECVVSREEFLGLWPEMVSRLGVPLSTPNEVAIHLVARMLRSFGQVVAISGEGADELFGGYDSALNAAHAFFRASPGASPEDHARMALADAAWITPEMKREILNEPLRRGLEDDAGLAQWYASEIAELRRQSTRDEVGPIERGVQTHLRLLRRVNLSGLLQRLDTATMLAGVEGRTPLADAAVALHAEGLALPEKFEAGQGVRGTKIALRRAFGADLPREILERPKASFPLPFQSWVGGLGSVVRGSGLCREMLRADAIEAIAAGLDGDAPGAWRVGWPVLNLAVWGRGLA